MLITIAYLYYDLLNLYGENGNIKALKKQFTKQNIKVVIKLLDLHTKIQFDEYDLIYIGGGTPSNIDLALTHLLKYKKEFETFIENNKFILATGNAYELFGKYIKTNDKIVPALNIFSYYTKRSTHIATDSLFTWNDKEKYILGFQNQESVIKDNNNYYFKVIKGLGSYPGSTGEGYKYKHFYGTYLIGPFLIRNPHFLEYFVKTIITSQKKDFKFKPFDLKLEKKAYKAFISNNYHKDI